MAKPYNLKLHRLLISDLILVRKTADNLKNRIFMKGLEESVLELGVLMPLLVTKSPDYDYKFILIDGYKRLEVLKKLNREQLAVNVLIAEGIPEDMSLSANLVRMDLSKLYQALYLHNILIKEKITQDELARRFMLSKGEISKLLSVAKQPVLVNMVSSGLTMTSAKSLAISVSSLPNDIQEKQLTNVKKALPFSDVPTRRFEKIAGIMSEYIKKTHKPLDTRKLVKLYRYIESGNNYIHTDKIVNSLVDEIDIKNIELTPEKLIDTFKIICMENPESFKYEINNSGLVSLRLKMTDDEYKKFKKLLIYNPDKSKKRFS